MRPHVHMTTRTVRHHDTHEQGALSASADEAEAGSDGTLGAGGLPRLVDLD